MKKKILAKAKKKSYLFFPIKLAPCSVGSTTSRENTYI